MKHQPSMKAKSNRKHRKHPRCTTLRRRTMAARMKAGLPKREQPRPQQLQPVDAAVPQSPVETMLGNAAACSDVINLIRSAVNDEDGSYLVMSIEVPVSFTAAYDAWTRFDDVPHFMRGRDLSESNDGSRMTWRIRTLFDEFAWQAKVSEQTPFEFIAWKSVLGTPHPGFGSVSFEPISQLRSWILVQVAFDMSGIYRWLGDPLPSLSHSLEQTLKRFYDSMAIQPLEEKEHQPTCLANAAA
jgi:uncharacterized membrane protein